LPSCERTSAGGCHRPRRITPIGVDGQSKGRAARSSTSLCALRLKPCLAEVGEAGNDSGSTWRRQRGSRQCLASGQHRPRVQIWSARSTPSARPSPAQAFARRGTARVIVASDPRSCLNAASLAQMAAPAFVQQAYASSGAAVPSDWTKGARRKRGVGHRSNSNGASLTT